MVKSSKHYSLFYALILLLVLGFHINLIIQDPLLYRDDILLVSGVKDTVSLSHYVERLKEGILYDLQPIRDITFYLNLKLNDWFGYGGFHLTNLFLMFGILSVNRKNLRTLGLSELGILLGTLLLAVHPVFNSSTAWVANRKHLLSILFLTLYIAENLKKEPSSAKSFGWVFLSFLSQPITVFIPVGVILYRKLVEKKGIKAWDWAIGGLTLVVLGANYIFYNSNIRFAGRNSFDAATSDISLYILRMGRVAVQLLLPVNLAVEYNIGNPINFLGIALTVGLVYLYFKFEKDHRKTFFYCLLLSTLFPVLKWGPRDAYLLTVLLLGTYFFVKLFDRYREKKFWPYVMVPYFCFLAFFSVKFTNMWIHDIVLHKVSYETEGGADNYFRYASIMAIYNPDKAYEIYKEAFELYPTFVGSVPLSKKAEALYEAPTLTDQQKLDEFRKEQVPDIFSVFFEMKILERLGMKVKASNARRTLLESFHNNPSYQYEFWQTMCLKYPQDCRDLGIKK